MANTPILSLPYPTEDDTVDPPRDFEALASALDPLGVVPVGAMLMWITAAAPGGWLLMQGQLVDGATYPGLAALLGQDGNGKVTIPDMRDTFPVGAGATMALGSVGGTSSVALTTAQMPVHSHNGKTGGADRPLTHSHIVQTAGTPVGGGAVGYTGIAKNSGTFWGETQDSAAPDHLHIISPEGGGTAHENRPPFRSVNFIIRAG